jgi:uncharacterized protein
VVAVACLPVAAFGAESNRSLNQSFGNPDYGVCRGTNPACYHDWGVLPREQRRVLLWTRTAGPRHANLGPALQKGLNPPLDAANVVQAGMVKLAAASGFALDYAEDPAEFTRLNRYNAVIFFSTSRDTLDDGMQTALRQYIRSGGGFVGIHNAFGTEYNWPWYEGLLGNANYFDHGPHQNGDVVIVDSKDESTRGLPKRFAFKDEWYNLIPYPTNVRFLATVDVGTLTGGTAKGPAHPGHGEFHPVAWCQYYDGGRSWVTTLGHDAAIFNADNSQFPGALEFQQLIAGGIKSVIGMAPFCQ